MIILLFTGEIIFLQPLPIIDFLGLVQDGAVADGLAVLLNLFEPAGASLGLDVVLYGDPVFPAFFHAVALCGG